MLIQLVADYGHGDLAFAEVEQRLLRHLPGARVVPTPVGPFDTLAAGFCVGQLALTPGPPGLIVFHNVAPRTDDDAPRPGNEGERFLAGRLADDVLVVGPDAGYAFSFVRDHITELRPIKIGTGSQFRSRDELPARIAELASGDTTRLGDPVDPAEVPAVPAGRVAYVDGYGNLKTTWSDPPAESGSTVVIEIDGVMREATVSDGTFDVPHGAISFAPGSSGWAGTRWYELLLRGGSAAERFGHPAPGARVRLRP